MYEMCTCHVYKNIYRYITLKKILVMHTYKYMTCMYTYDGKYERIDQSLHIAIEVEYSTTHTILQHPV